VHEAGHALVAARLRLNPSITLHAFGGLCHHEQAERDAHDVWILLAGPGFGLLLGGLALAVNTAMPYAFASAGSEAASLQAMVALTYFLNALTYIGLVWNGINLLPIWPLDGGRLARLALIRVFKPAAAERALHLVSIGLLVVGGVALWSWLHSILVLLLAGLLVWQNVQVLRGEASSGAFRSRQSLARTLLKQAEAAFAEGDHREAARLCHQLRAESTIPRGVLDACWRVLGIATLRAGQPAEAVSYLKRAPLDRDVALAWAEALSLTGQHEALEALYADRAFLRLPQAVRDEAQQRFGTAPPP
jgi:Zn-dependent protease